MAGCAVKKKRSGFFVFISGVLVILLLSSAESPAAERILSLYPGHSDNVIALGAGDRLAGLSDSDRADMLPELPRLSLRSDPETILKLNPDLVLTRRLAEKLNPSRADVLRSAGVKVVMLEPPTWDDFPDYLKKLALEIGSDPDKAIEALRSAQDEIVRTVETRRKGRPSPRVFVEATGRELHTCSPGSWAARLIALTGGTNAAASAEPLRRGSALAPWGLERLLSLAGNVDIYLIQQGAMNRTTLEQARERPWMSAMGGVRLAAQPEYLLSRPSLLSLREGAAALMDLFWGEEKKQ